MGSESVAANAGDDDEADVQDEAVDALITALAEYERMADAVVNTEARLRETLFGPHARAEFAGPH